MAIPDTIVIVGGGLTAVHAVRTLREEGFTGSITVVGREPHAPYERPPLTKSFLTGAKPVAVAFPHDEEWYAGQGVRLVTGTAAVGIDRAARTVTLETGETLPYDALLLATGAEPRVPHLPGAETAHYVRTIEDSERLKAALEQAGEGGRLAIVGGGWIGLEVAAAARGYGLDVTVLERGERPLQPVLGPELADYLVGVHTRHGVDVRTGVSVTAVTPEGVETDDGPVAADLVVVAIGATPVTALAEVAGLAVDDGILVDQRLRTSDPAVYAAGDVANALNTTLGTHLRVEHWDNAIRQGRLAARTMLGRDDVYDWEPYFYTDQFEFSMEYVGHSSGSDEVVVRGSLESDEFVAYWLAEHADGLQVTAGMNVNVWDVNDRLRELVGTTVRREELTDLR